MPRKLPGGSDGTQPTGQGVGLSGLPDSVAALWAYLENQQYAPLRQFGNEMAGFAKTVEAALAAEHAVYHKHWVYWYGHRERTIGKLEVGIVFPNLASIWAALFSDRRQATAATAGLWKQTVRLVAQAVIFSARYASWLVSAERAQRRRAIRQAEAQARQQIKALHQLVEQEATAGYQQAGQGQASPAQRILEYLGQHNPLVSRLVRDVITGTLDLASIDDPALRWITGHILSALINRLGVDKLAGQAAEALIGPWIADPRPRGVKDVIQALTARTAALEAAQAQFWANGGSEIEQAGSQWADITGPLTDAALLAFYGTAVIDPAGWARDISATAGALVNDTITAAASLIRKA